MSMSAAAQKYIEKLRVMEKVVLDLSYKLLSDILHKVRTYLHS